MKLIIFLIYTPFVYTELHTFTTTYSGVTGIPGFPEFSAVTTLDGQQIDYYDSNIKQIIPKQEWMKRFASKRIWQEDTEIREHVHQIYKSNIKMIMERFNQSGGIHTYQRMYGCEWDDETEVSHGFDMYGYDGEDFITLDLRESRYITSVKQALPTVQKWNNKTDELENLQNYYKYDCVYWLKSLYWSRKDALKWTAPEVFVLQKDPSSLVMCHATGFYPSAVSITWMKNGLDHYGEIEIGEIEIEIEIGEILPNEDGTFQKTSSLNVPPEDWKRCPYMCVVEHQSLTENIQKILREVEIKSNKSHTNIYYPILGIMVATFIGLLLILVLYKHKCLHQTKLKDNIE